MKNFIDHLNRSLKQLAELQGANSEEFEAARQEILQGAIQRLFPEKAAQGAMLQREIDWVISANPEPDERWKKLTAMTVRQMELLVEAAERALRELKSAQARIDQAEPGGSQPAKPEGREI